MLSTNKIATVLSARMGSRRLPGKALLPLGGVPILQFIIERLRTSQFGGRVILATTTRSDDDALAMLGRSLGIEVYRGAESDVASRYVQIARLFHLDWIVRVTGDCPFIDGTTLDHCLRQWSPSSANALWTTKTSFPVGIDYELFPSYLITSTWHTMSDEEREHVTLRFYAPSEGRWSNPKVFSSPVAWRKGSAIYTVDTLGDYRRACALVNHFGRRDFSVQDLVNYEMV